MREGTLSRLAVYLGTVVVVGGLGRFHAVSNHYAFAGSARFAWSILLVTLLCTAAYGLGIPDVVPDARSAVARSLAAVAVSSLAISVLQLFGGEALLPRFVVFGSCLVLIPWYVGISLAAESRKGRAAARDPVFVVGADADVEALRSELALAPERPAVVVGSLPVERCGRSSDGTGPLVTAVVGAGASLLVLSARAQADEGIVHQAAELHARGVRIRSLSLFYEQWLGKLPVSELERVSLFFDIGELHRATYARVSRLLDLALAVVGVAVLALAVPVIVLGNLVANRGPLFYRQPRVGKGGATFEIHKFRTMLPGDHGLVNEWTTEDDPRITRFGGVLRRTHLDELPQVIDILRGDLSVVGPRPEQPRYVAELVAKLPFYDFRHLVRPGLTGWAQVKYGYAGNESDALEKLQYEFFYLRHQSLGFDLRVIARTLRSVLGREGR